LRFAKRSESEFDAFGRTQLYFPFRPFLGMAIAAQITGDFNKHHYCCNWRGLQFASGMAFGGLNACGATDFEHLNYFK